jgi:hypothetical protein
MLVPNSAECEFISERRERIITSSVLKRFFCFNKNTDKTFFQYPSPLRGEGRVRVGVG